MASYNELLALIDAYINQNGVQAITGQVLNGVLRAMVDQLGRGYSIMGAADPTTDPGTPDGPETWFASVPGTYTNFDGIQIVDGELALLSYEPSTGFSKNTIYEGFQTVQATIDGNVGTPAVGVSYANGILSFDFHNMKGVTGDPAGFGAVTASVDSNIGTPSVQVQTSGPDTAKAIAFQFHNLKGETGVTSVLATVDNTSGNPQCAVSLNGQQLVLNFTGLKGAQGDTGSSVDYPFTIVNNLTTNDATKALSAAMGVQLESEVSQLEAKVFGFTSPIFSTNGWNNVGFVVELGKSYRVKVLSGRIAGYRIANGNQVTHDYYAPEEFVLTAVASGMLSVYSVGSTQLFICDNVLDKINPDIIPNNAITENKIQDESVSVGKLKMTAPSQTSVPQGCLNTLNFPSFGDIEVEEEVSVNSAEELSVALNSGSNTAIVLNADIITGRVTNIQKNKLIVGNGHKLAGYSYSYGGEPQYGTTTHNAFTKQGVFTTSYVPQPYFFDSEFHHHQWKKSDWFDAASEITKADGSVATANFGQHRLLLPSNFTLTNEELDGTFVQFFIPFASLVAKVDKIEDGYLYFTTTAEVTIDTTNPNNEFTTNNQYTSFRIFNLKGDTSIYFDDDYIYIPKNIGTLYYSGIIFGTSAKVNLSIEDCVLIGQIDFLDITLSSFKLTRCEVAYTNRSIFSDCQLTYLWLDNVLVHDAMRDAFIGTASYNRVEYCTFRNVGKSRRNDSAILVNSGYYWIHHNTISDFGYCAIRTGNVGSSIVPPAGIIEYNRIYQTPQYVIRAKHNVTSDGGAIYIFTYNNKSSVGAIIRHNIIHNYRGRSANHGIYCDDGACYFFLYGNQISATDGRSIDARYATGRVGPTGYADNNGKVIVRNVCDSIIRCVVGENSIVDESIVVGNVRVYGEKWEDDDTINKSSESALLTYEETKRDIYGHFDADGFVCSSVWATE